MPVLTWIQNTALAEFVGTSFWGYPAVLTAHTLGLAALVGASVVLSLRMLGCFASAPLEPFRRVFPIMWTGFWTNALSGVALFAADATNMGTQVTFYVKLLLVVAGLLLVTSLRRRVLDNPRTPRLGAVPAPGRTLALASLVCWGSAIVAGRLLAYV